MKRMLIALLTMFSSAAFAGPKDDMMAADRAFSAMSVAKGTHPAFLAYMTDDARLYEGPKPPIVGKKAAAAFYAEQDKKGGPKYLLQWEPTEAEASDDGSLGWTRGTWSASGKSKDGKDVKRTGYYVTEWRRQKDGKYKFDVDIGGADEPAQ